MMKKIVLILLIFAFSLAVFYPLKTDAAERLTVRILKEQYAAEKEKYDNNQAKINLTQSQINNKKNTIERLKKELTTISEEASILQEEIEKYKVDIKDKIIESRTLIEQFQLNNDENSNLYYDYIFNSSSVSDMVYRSAVIKEIMEYNEKTIDTLNTMIDDNKKREEEIARRKEEINKLEAELASEVVSLGEQKATLTSGGLSIEKQLAKIQENINYYVKLGCKLDDVIGINCAVPKSTGEWRRPTTTGYITQNAYYGSSYTHRALDIGSSNGSGEKIYPILDGTITGIYYDIYGAKIVQMEHYKGGTYYTSLYVHLSSWSPNIYVGKQVNSNEYLGYMGATGKATGIHLHIEVFPCRLYTDTQCKKWDNWVSFAQNKLRSGYNPRQLIPVTNGLYNKWYNR